MIWPLTHYKHILPIEPLFSLGNQNHGWETKLGETMIDNKCSKQQNRKHSGWN